MLTKCKRYKQFKIFLTYSNFLIKPQAVTHSLVLLNMGKIISRNMLSWLEILMSRYFCTQLVVYIIYIN